MAPLFGWPEAGDATAHRDQWEAAEAATNAAMGRAFAALDEAERRRFVELADAAEAGRT
jgi:hypothetical protein